jgi:hypothetical protein
MNKFIIFIVLLCVASYSVHCSKLSPRSLINEDSESYSDEYLKEIYKRESAVQENKPDLIAKKIVESIFDELIHMNPNKIENSHHLNQASKKEKRKKIPFRWG